MNSSHSLRGTPAAELRVKIFEAIGRGYTHKNTEHKPVDYALAIAINKEVLEVVKSRDEELISGIEKKRITISAGKCPSCNNPTILGFHVSDADEHYQFYNLALDDVIALIRKRL